MVAVHRTFAGRVCRQHTIASSAARRALLSTGAARTAAKAVQHKTNTHLRSTAARSYARSELNLSGKFLAYSAGELGGYAGESAFDHLLRLNETMEGGMEVSSSGQSEPHVVSFCTGSRPTDVPSLQIRYFICLHRLTAVLIEKRQLAPAAVGGLVYPVEIMENNMIVDMWDARRPTVYSTPFGYVRMWPYTLNDGFHVCDFHLHDRHMGRDMTFQGIPAARYDRRSNGP
jgi:hypothetical protein